MSYFTDVQDFHTAIGEANPTELTLAPATIALRARLITEEYREVFAAIEALYPNVGEERRTAGELLGELVDLVYVCLGTAAALGLPFDAAFAAVHQANLAKVGANGPVFDGSGKLQKPDGWQKPNVTRLLES